MSYDVYNENNKSLGQAATTLGMRQMSDWVEKNGSEELKKFFNDGETKNPSQVSKDALDCATKAPNTIKATLINLSDLLKKAKGYAAIG